MGVTVSEEVRGHAYRIPILLKELADYWNRSNVVIMFTDRYILV